MKKSKILILAFLLIGVAISGYKAYESYNFKRDLLITGLEALAQDKIKISKDGLEGEIDSGVIRCRCKDGGCYGGNAISFRAKCAIVGGKEVCNDFGKNNCPS